MAEETSMMGCESEMRRQEQRKVIFVYAVGLRPFTLRWKDENPQNRNVNLCCGDFYRIDLCGEKEEEEEEEGEGEEDPRVWRYPCTLSDNRDLHFNTVGLQLEEGSSVDVVYALGGGFIPRIRGQSFALRDSDTGEHYRVHTGVSRLHLRGKGAADQGNSTGSSGGGGSSTSTTSTKKMWWEWEEAPEMVCDYRDDPMCASLDGKVYAFRGAPSFGEVLDPQFGHWRELNRPDHLDDYPFLVRPVIPDAANHRLLVLFLSYDRSQSALYAFYPPQQHQEEEKWEPLSLNNNIFKRLWYHPSAVANAVVDDVLYFHDHHYKEHGVFDSCIGAYHLSERRWLKVLGCSGIPRYKYPYLLHLGNHLFCLAFFSPGSPCKNKTALAFVNFTAQRAPEGHVCVTYVSSRVHFVDLCTVINFIPISS